MPNNGEPRRAITLGGGGPAAGLHIGVLEALANEPSITFDVWSLSCIGAWVGIVYNQSEKKTAKEKVDVESRAGKLSGDGKPRVSASYSRVTFVNVLGSAECHAYNVRHAGWKVFRPRSVCRLTAQQEERFTRLGSGSGWRPGATGVGCDGDKIRLRVVQFLNLVTFHRRKAQLVQRSGQGNHRSEQVVTPCRGRKGLHLLAFRHVTDKRDLHRRRSASVKKEPCTGIQHRRRGEAPNWRI